VNAGLSDWFYSLVGIGEVECVASSSDKTDAALSKVTDVMSTLGLTVLDSSHSKMYKYLETHNKDLLQRLVDQRTL